MPLMERKDSILRVYIHAFNDYLWKPSYKRSFLSILSDIFFSRRNNTTHLRELLLLIEKQIATIVSQISRQNDP